MIGNNKKKDEGPGALAAALERAGVRPDKFPAPRSPDASGKKSEVLRPPRGWSRGAEQPSTPVVAPTPDPAVEEEVEARPRDGVETGHPPTATSGLSFGDLKALGAVEALPEGTEVKLPSGIGARRTATGVEIVTTTPPPAVIEKKKATTPPLAANEGFNPLALLNPSMTAEAQAKAVKDGEAARERREKEDESRRRREAAAQAERQAGGAHPRGARGQVARVLRSHKGAKALERFRGKDGKVDMGDLARALGDRCAITGRQQRRGGGVLLLIGEWGFMVDAEFDRETAIHMAKAEERKLRVAAAEKAEEKRANEVVEAIRASGSLVLHKEKEQDFLPLPTFSKGGVPRLDWKAVRETLRGTTDPLTGETVERPGAFLLSFPEDKEGEEAAGLRLLSGFSRRLLAQHPDLLGEDADGGGGEPLPDGQPLPRRRQPGGVRRSGAQGRRAERRQGRRQGGARPQGGPAPPRHLPGHAQEGRREEEVADRPPAQVPPTPSYDAMWKGPLLRCRIEECSPRTTTHPLRLPAGVLHYKHPRCMRLLRRRTPRNDVHLVECCHGK